MGANKSKEIHYLMELAEKAQNSSNFTLPEEEVKRLIVALNSGRPVRQQWAANVISYLCRENAENRNRLGPKSMKVLSVLLKSENSKIQTWAICAVGNLCIDSPQNQTKFIGESGMERSIQLLKSIDFQVQRWAANAIGIICIDNTKNQELVAKLGGIQPLVDCLKSLDTQVQRWAVFALGNIAYFKDNNVSIVNAGAMKPLVKILSYDADREAQRWAANVIAILCADKPGHRSKLSEAGGIKNLVALLKCDDEKVIRNATFALANSTIEHEENQKQIIDAGALETLVELLKSSNKKGEQIKYYASMIIVNMGKVSDDFPVEVKALAKENGTKTIIGKKLVDMIDGSHTVAMRLSKRIPAFSEFYGEEASPRNSPRSSESEEKNSPKVKFHEPVKIEDKVEPKVEEVPEPRKEKKDSNRRKTVSEAMESWSIHYEDLQIDFDILIGVGAFGNVFKGKYFGTDVAVKEMLNAEEEAVQTLIVREIETLKNIRHPNVVQWMGCCVHESGLFIVTEYVSGGDLRQLLKNRDELLPWSIKMKIAMDICYAMCFLHSKSTLHRDLKSKNVLVEETSFKAKVCDFGFAREFNDKKKSLITYRVGTDSWMAPEVLLSQTYGFAADVFSFGIILFELLTRRKPPKRQVLNGFTFAGNEFVDKIKECSESTPEVEELTKIALECTDYNPENRPLFPQVLKNLEALTKSTTTTPEQQ